jgi:AbrB family looped-hinge helix DNA binding protein
MSHHERTVKISSKGQITLPKPARDALGSDFVRVIVSEQGTVSVQAVPNLGGALNKYAKNAGPARSWDEMRDKAWEAEVRDRQKPKRR